MTPPGKPAFSSATSTQPSTAEDILTPTKGTVETEGVLTPGKTNQPKADKPWRKVVSAATKQPAASADSSEKERAAITEAFKSENPEHKREFGWVKLSDLVVDEDVQRPLNPGEVARIAADFNEQALGTVTVSARVDPDTGDVTFILIDGQQRRAGALKAGFDGIVRADVHYGLSTRDEAKLFRQLNFRRAVSPNQLFRVALVEEDPDTMAVHKILTDLGISFATPRGFNGSKTALKLIKRRNGETALRWAFTQAQKIYDADGRGGCYDTVVIEALWHLYQHFGSRIDEDNLYLKLAKHGGGTPDLIGQARTIKMARQGRLLTNVIRAILVRYNANKHVGSRAILPDWTLDAKAEKDLEADGE